MRVSSLICGRRGPRTCDRAEDCLADCSPKGTPEDAKTVCACLCSGAAWPGTCIRGTAVRASAHFRVEGLALLLIFLKFHHFRRFPPASRPTGRPVQPTSIAWDDVLTEMTHKICRTAFGQDGRSNTRFSCKKRIFSKRDAQVWPPSASPSALYAPSTRCSIEIKPYAGFQPVCDPQRRARTERAIFYPSLAAGGFESRDLPDGAQHVFCDAG